MDVSFMCFSHISLSAPPCTSPLRNATVHLYLGQELWHSSSCNKAEFESWNNYMNFHSLGQKVTCSAYTIRVEMIDFLWQMSYRMPPLVHMLEVDAISENYLLFLDDFLLHCAKILVSVGMPVSAKAERHLIGQAGFPAWLPFMAWSRSSRLSIVTFRIDCGHYRSTRQLTCSWKQWKLGWSARKYKTACNSRHLCPKASFCCTFSFLGASVIFKNKIIILMEGGGWFRVQTWFFSFDFQHEHTLCAVVCCVAHRRKVVMHQRKTHSAHTHDTERPKLQEVVHYSNSNSLRKTCAYRSGWVKVHYRVKK